jgi:hypothetical protein
MSHKVVKDQITQNFITELHRMLCEPTGSMNTSPKLYEVYGGNSTATTASYQRLQIYETDLVVELMG